MAIDLNIVPDDGDEELATDLNIVPDGDEPKCKTCTCGRCWNPSSSGSRSSPSTSQEGEVHRHHEDQAHSLLEDEQDTVHVIDLNIAA